MNRYWKLLQTGLVVAFGAVIMASSGTALAQARDCSKASDSAKAQCEARNRADAKCGNLEGDARRICQRDELPRDCSKEDNKTRCESEVAAHKACRSDAKTYRTCFEAKTKKG